ncbi:RNA polymerase sigma-70 factor (ECF subfamily) [Arcicella aurantiaca]|uniref:RNA polymerase sigma-70 factor (ECF subfamily) n=1 Tax=Arcicella aurantiaca TaxID=591202 RepID=A0A316DEH6_9BACT|nr:RNA polymerase sigma-70 factor [Arcicella aurantiaca]PWK16126.1 RNA polymerase sigma-70 factor (ECF subfamily) [Arcicella aurantiaca]
MIQIPDSDILLAIRQGNERVFETVFKKHYQALCNYACGILKDMDDAEEVVQSIFLKFWEQRAEIEISVSLKSYLYRAVHNTCLNRLKHLKIQETYRQYVGDYLENTHDSATDILDKVELESRIADALEKLPEQCRLIFKMSRFEELKYQEIADRLRLSIKTVENQIGKALKIMRTELADYLPIILLMMLFF